MRGIRRRSSVDVSGQRRTKRRRGSRDLRCQRRRLRPAAGPECRADIAPRDVARRASDLSARREQPTLAELFRNLRYEAHGALWDMLVWVLAHLGGPPASMQVLHAAIAAAAWIIVYRWSPFTALEKFLLLLSYFLFFEYFVISRSYGSRDTARLRVRGTAPSSPSWRLAAVAPARAAREHQRLRDDLVDRARGHVRRLKSHGAIGNSGAAPRSTSRCLRPGSSR